MKKKSGFTVLEISVLAVFLLAIGVIFWFQKIEITQKANDEKLKNMAPFFTACWAAARAASWDLVKGAVSSRCAGRFRSE